MNNTNIFATNTRDARAYLEEMFAKTINGEICIARYQDDFAYVTAESLDDATHIEKYSIVWSQHNLRSIYGLWQDRVREIYAIAQADDWSQLSGWQKFIYDKYIAEATIDETINDDYCALVDRVGSEVMYSDSEVLTDADKLVINAYENAVAESYQKRLKDHFKTPTLVCCCQRLYKLAKINSPRILLENEECCLIDALVLWVYATSMEKLSK